MRTEDRWPVYYPLYLNVSGKKCVVVGGGEVATRKAKALLEAGANVIVISPEICQELAELGEQRQISVVIRDYQKDDLCGAFLAIVATNSREVNARVVNDARQLPVLVNVVDDAEDSDFILPSYFRRGDITIAISSAGRSPALTRKIRTRLEGIFGDEYATLAILISQVRTELRKQGIKVNAEIWQEALNLDLLITLLRLGKDEEAKTLLLNKLQARQEQLLS